MKIDRYRKIFAVMLIIGVLIGVIIGGGVGFYLGAKAGMQKCVSLASEFLIIDYDKMNEMIKLYEKYKWRLKDGTAVI